MGVVMFFKIFSKKNRLSLESQIMMAASINQKWVLSILRPRERDEVMTAIALKLKNENVSLKKCVDYYLPIN